MNDSENNSWSHPAALSNSELLEQCSLKRTRGSGPGGQHRNKVETAMVITHQPTGIIGQASERRSQNDNRKVALRRLRINLAVGHRTELNSEFFSASSLWQSKIKDNRISINANHEDFPCLLAEALDVVAHLDWEVSSASKRLACTSSQLIKFFKKEPSAFAMVNRQRKALGQSSYK